jgi:hypothetical protein
MGADVVCHVPGDILLLLLAPTTLALGKIDATIDLSPIIPTARFD